MVLRKLAISNILVRKVRTALTIAAIALSVSLVVSVTSGFKSFEAAVLKFLNQYMGSADAIVTASFRGKVPESLLRELQADPSVRSAVGRLESQAMLLRAPSTEELRNRTTRPDHTDLGGTPADKITAQLIGIFSPGGEQTDTIEVTSGKWFDSATGNIAVLDEVIAGKLGVHIGDDIDLPTLAGTPLKLKVVGLVHKPTFFAERSNTIYVPIQTLQRFTSQDSPPQLSRISVYLRENADYDAFKKRWTDRMASIDPNLRLRMRRDNAGEVEKDLKGIDILSYFGGAVSMVTAMFVTFSALSMGVTERQRTLAMLRAIGGTRAQVGKLVLLEGLIFAAVGVALGILLGMLWTEMLALRYPDAFAAGALPSVGGVIFASAGSLLTALAASLLPAWTATRVSPIEAMNSHAAGGGRHGPPVGWAIVGAILVSVDPLICYGPLERIVGIFHTGDIDELTRGVRLYAHFGLGLPAIMLGFFLLAPLFVWILERVLAPLVAAPLALPVKLLRQQLSGGMWRAAGTGAALMVGLATLIVLQVQGRTLLDGWRLPDKFPDIFIWSGNTISWTDQSLLANLPGIAPGSLMPCVVTSPHGDNKMILLAETALPNENIGAMFFAVNPAQALSMIELEYRDNDGIPYPRQQQHAVQQQVIAEMQKGRRIIVTDEFRQAKHLKIGDEVVLNTSKNGRQTYTICGIVWSPGVDVMIGMYDLEDVLDQQTVGSVFGSIDDAKQDYGAAGTWLFAANLQGGLDKDKVLKDVQKVLGDRGLRAGDVRHIKYAIEQAFSRLLLIISSVAFAAMAVASLGVTNTVMASVRTRRWQFGVLRSVGVSRGGLLRLVIAEAALLGIVGIALGLAAGALLSVDARVTGSSLIGYAPPMVIPWPAISIGCATVMFVALAASIWPAIAVARTEVLELLQAGRGST